MKFATSFTQLPAGPASTDAKILHTLVAMNAKRIWRDDEGRVVLWQSPNIWLIIWALGEIAGRLIKSDTTSKSIYLIAVMSIAVWAVLEILQGVNYFRRILGLVVFVLTIIPILKAIF